MSYVNDAEFNPYAAPKAATAGYENEALTHVEYGGFWVRFVAQVIDAVILSGIGILFNLVLAVFIAVSNLDPLIPSILVMLVQWGIQVVYAPLMLSSEKQATYGKIAMGLKVVNLQGRRLSFWHALGREIAKFLSAIILFIGYIMAAFTERKQGLHDMIAGTLVIRSR